MATQPQAAFWESPDWGDQSNIRSGGMPFWMRAPARSSRTLCKAHGNWIDRNAGCPSCAVIADKALHRLSAPPKNLGFWCGRPIRAQRYEVHKDRYMLFFEGGQSVELTPQMMSKEISYHGN